MAPLGQVPKLEVMTTRMPYVYDCERTNMTDVATRSTVMLCGSKTQKGAVVLQVIIVRFSKMRIDNEHA